MSRVLETVLTGRNLLSPVLASASKDVVAFNTQVAGAQEKAAAGATTSAARQEAAAAKIAASSTKASSAASSGAAVQSKAATDVGQANTRAAESATASANVQSRAHAKAAESATLSARAQQSANRALSASNGLLGTSLTPLTAGLGALALGLGYAAYRGMEFDTTMSQVQAATMATAGTMGQLRDLAIDQGAKTKYSSEEAAQGITEMAKAGVSTADILHGGLAGALNLAAAGQIAVGDAAEIAATQLTVFGLKGDQVNHVADLLAAGAGKAQGSVQDMALALQYAGLPAKGLSMSIEETTGALGLFAANGLVGEKAGTSFRGMLTSLVNPGTKTANLMDDLNLSFFDAQGNFVGMSGVAQELHDKLGPLSEQTRNQALAQIFGNEALGAAQILYKVGAPGVEQWTKNVNDAGYAARQASINQDNLRGDLEKLGGAFDSTMTTIGGGTQGPLRDLVQMLTSVVGAGGDVINFVGSLPGPFLVATVAALGWAVAGGKIMEIIRPMGGAVGGLRDTWSAFSEALGYARANGDGLGTVLHSVGESAGGAVLSGLKTLGRAIGPELGVAAATLAVIKFTDVLLHAGYTTVDVAGYQKTLAAALKSTNGVIDESVRAMAAQQAADQKLSGDTNLLRVSKAAGVELPRLTDALLGNKGAYDDVAGSLQRYQDAHTSTHADAQGVLVTTLDKEGKGAEDARNALDKLLPTLAGAVEDNRLLAEATAKTGDGLDKVGASGAAAGTGMDVAAASAEATFGSLEGYAAALGLDKDATQELIDKSNELGKSLADFVDPLGTYTGLLQAKAQAEADAANKTAEKTGAASKSWEDFKDSVHVTFDEYMADLEGQVAAQANWQTNMLMLAGRVSAGTLAELAKMGPEGAPLVADLVNRSDAELAQFSEVTAKRSQEATNAWGATLTMAQPVLSQIAKTAGQGVVNSLAEQLQAGTITVAQIAAQYGIKLAGGINPVLDALGRNRVPVGSEAAHMGGYSSGGFTGRGGKLEPAGIVHRGEVVFSQEDVAAHGGPQRVEAMRTSRRGYAGGGFVTAADVPRPPSTAPFRAPISTVADAAMGKEYDEVTAWMKTNGPGVLGNGAVGGDWQSIFTWVKARIPEARVNSAYRPGDPGYHGKGKAVDFGFGSAPGGNGSAGLASINRLLYDGLGKNLAELIYDGVGDDRPDLWHGGPHTYSAGTQAEHHNHVHAAVYDQGGLATGAGYLSKATVEPERVLSPRQTEAFERWMAAPAAMPGYGSGSGGSGGGIDYDRLATAISKAGPRETTVSVDARGLNADQMASKVVQRLDEREWLSTPA